LYTSRSKQTDDPDAFPQSIQQIIIIMNIGYSESTLIKHTLCLGCIYYL